VALFAFSLAGPRAAPPGGQALTILHTNDIHGRVLGTDERQSDGAGGLARLATLVRRLRAENPNVLLLDVGDATQGTPVDFLDRGASMVAAMNAVGYDAATLGNHEFDWSRDVTAAHAAQAHFPYLAANLRDRRTGRVFEAAREWLIVKRGGIRVGLFGLTTLQTLQIEWPPFLRDIRFEDPVETARRVVPELRRRCDLVVLLSHLGLDEDRKLAAAVPGIDVILGGHSHTELKALEKVGDTILAHTGAYAKYLGRIDLRMEQTGRAWRLASVNGLDGAWWPDARYPRAALLEAGPEVEPDTAVMAVYEPAWDRVSKQMSERIADVPEAIPGRNGRTKPMPLQAVFAELLRESVGADAALVSGGIGPDLPAGPMTAGDVYALVGGYTRQNVVMVRATGRVLREAVERTFIAPNVYPHYWAGVRGRVVRTGNGARLEDASVGGRPLVDDTLYTVAGPSHLIMDQTALFFSPLVSDTLGWQKPLLVEAIRRRGRLTVDAVNGPQAP
jgi:2',3'-cyclic-nucleotide 2'-phosphodiesterase (5'-nucleotidase family)